MARIDYFNENELWIVQTTLQERYGEERELQTGDLDLTECIVTLFRQRLIRRVTPNRSRQQASP